MAYTTSDDIVAEFKDIVFSSATSVTLTNISEFIVQEEAYLDAELATIYVVPITDTPATTVMKMLSTFLVKARVLDILQVKTSVAKVDQGYSSKFYRDRVDSILEKIKKKKMILEGATLLESSGGVKSYAVENDLCHVFKKETEQW